MTRVIWLDIIYIVTVIKENVDENMIMIGDIRGKTMMKNLT